MSVKIKRTLFWVGLLCSPIVANSCRLGSASSSSETQFFPPEGVDHLALRVQLDVEIFGIGEDHVELVGTAVVHRSGGQGADGKEMVGELVGASLQGQSQVFGPIVAWRSPITHSPCRYTYLGPHHYDGEFTIDGWFWLPKHKLALFSAQPVVVRGAARAIPPVGQAAAMEGQPVALHDFNDPQGNPIGVLSSATGYLGDLISVTKHLDQPGTTVPALASP